MLAAQSSCDNVPSSPANNHHCSDVVYWRGGDCGKGMKDMNHVILFDHCKVAPVSTSCCFAVVFAVICFVVVRSRRKTDTG